MLWNGHLEVPIRTIYNLWGDFVRNVYAGFRQFEYEDYLHEAVKETWGWIIIESLKILVGSMSISYIKLIEKRGTQRANDRVGPVQIERVK